MNEHYKDNLEATLFDDGSIRLTSSTGHYFHMPRETAKSLVTELVRLLFKKVSDAKASD